MQIKGRHVNKYDISDIFHPWTRSLSKYVYSKTCEHSVSTHFRACRRQPHRPSGIYRNTMQTKHRHATKYVTSIRIQLKERLFIKFSHPGVSRRSPISLWSSTAAIADQARNKFIWCTASSLKILAEIKILAKKVLNWGSKLRTNFTLPKFGPFYHRGNRS